MEESLSGRNFILKSIVGNIAPGAWAKTEKSVIKPGLVTYQWAKDWDFPSLFANTKKN